MTFTDIQFFELEKFFNDITIPKEVWVNAATRYTDAPTFITENLALLRNKELIPVIAEQLWRMLNQLKVAILDPVK